VVGNVALIRETFIAEFSSYLPWILATQTGVTRWGYVTPPAASSLAFQEPEAISASVIAALVKLGGIEGGDGNDDGPVPAPLDPGGEFTAGIGRVAARQEPSVGAGEDAIDRLPVLAWDAGRFIDDNRLFSAAPVAVAPGSSGGEQGEVAS
jgi:hypothetical protein